MEMVFIPQMNYNVQRQSLIVLFLVFMEQKNTFDVVFWEI